jgi:hypothetical protein
MPVAELLAKFPGFDISSAGPFPAHVAADIMINSRTVHTNIGICLDEAKRVSLVSTEIPPLSVELSEVKNWLAGQYARPLRLGTSDFINVDGGSDSYRVDSLLSGECTCHGLVSWTLSGTRVLAMKLSLVAGAPDYLHYTPDGGHRFDDERQRSEAWRYERCRQ